MICLEQGWELPEIFTDESYNRSNRWVISTSQMSNDGFVCGFAEVVEDGFGMCYSIRNDEIYVTISTNTQSPIIDANKFWAALGEAFASMKAICEANKSKL
jgi:carnitine O-acetyltransferase